MKRWIRNLREKEKNSSTPKFGASVLDAVLLAEVGGGLGGQELAEHLDVVLQVAAVSTLLFGIGRLIWNKISSIGRSWS